MLIQFSVENFRSFKNRAILSMEASGDTDHPENLTAIKKDRCLHTAAIFGANASGKSNLMEAFKTAISLVRNSNIRQVSDLLTEIVPFKFDTDSAAEPTSFEFVFYAEGMKYIYGFSATQKEVQTEYLYFYKTAKPSTVFERTDVNKYKYTSSELKKELKPLEERNTANKLFLATATAWNSKITRTPFLWFASRLNMYTADFMRLFPHAMPMFVIDENHSLQNFTTRLLHEADINIDNYTVESKDAAEEPFLQNQPKEIISMRSSSSASENKTVEIETIHTITQNDKTAQYSLPFGEESQGTRILFLLSPILKRALETGETLCVDEFDASLHPMLEMYLFSLFNNPDINKSHAQLIVSTHSMALMSLENLRRDQIYFVEKDQKTGVSDLYSLDEFSPRKEENIRKAYMFGRFGAVPDIAEGADLWR